MVERDRPVPAQPARPLHAARVRPGLPAALDGGDPRRLVAGYEAHIPVLFLPDPDDRHVLAAAIQAEAAVIVTFNLADFPAAALAPHGVRALHPDAYLTALLDDAPELFLMAAREHRAALTRPPKTADAYLQTLRANRLTQLASRLAEHLDEHLDEL